MMKKGLYAFLAALAVFALVITGCPDTGGGGGTTGGDPEITITFDLQGGPGTKGPVTKKGTKITLTSDELAGMPDGIAPVSGTDKIWSFLGWFDAATGGNEIDESTEFSANKTVYAQWDTSLNAPAAGKVAVVFKLNWPITGTPAPYSKDLNPGDNFSATDLAEPTGGNVPTKYGFVQWKNAAGEVITTTSTVPALASLGAIPVYELSAQWEELWTVTFDIRGGDDPIAPITGLKTGATVTRPATDPTKATDATGSFTFVDWFTSASATKKWDFTNDKVTKDTTIYAEWDWAPSLTGANAPKEKVTLSNANQVVYHFQLEGSATWADYEGITAEYMIESEDRFDVTNSARTIRLYGPYPADFFQFNTTTAGNKYAYASLTGATNNNEYIFDDVPGAGWKPLREALTQILGACPDAGEWFTIPYLIDGSRANVKPFKHQPEDTETGPFIFGLGLAGQDDKNTFYIKDVKLKAKADATGVTDVVGKALYITNTVDEIDTIPFDYPAFSAYGSRSGDGVDNVGRTTYNVSDKKIMAAVEAAPVTITFNLNASAGNPTFTAETGLTIDGTDSTLATKVTNKYNPITFPKATRDDSNIIDFWTTTATGTDKVSEGALYSTDTTLYAIWKAVTNATEDKVITPKISIFGGLGSGEAEGYGPFNYDKDAAYANAIWFGLTDAVTTALYKEVKIEFTISELVTSGTAKFKFHVGAANSWGSNEEVYKDFTANGDFSYTHTPLTSDAMAKGIIIQQNTGDSFKLTITKITLIAP
jgi:hypothetical protein